MHRTADYWVKKLGLQPHPEGGYFRETYRSDEKVSGPERYDGERCFSTAIFFMLRSGDFSAFHRLKSDEFWHYYTGGPATIHFISPDGEAYSRRVGNDPDSGQEFQVLIPRNSWFAAELDGPDSYILVGCTVAPGFEFRDFELGKRDDMLEIYPQHEALIRKFTRG